MRYFVFTCSVWSNSNNGYANIAVTAEVFPSYRKVIGMAKNIMGIAKTNAIAVQSYFELTEEEYKEWIK